VTSVPDPSPNVRIGLFGKLGAGNYGNDGSLEAVLAYVREHHPNADLDCMASGPEVVQQRYGVPAVALSWDQGGLRTGFRVLDLALTAVRVGVAAAVDAYRISRWTRGHSVAIVPGMGTFESTMQVRPWQTPWSLYALATSARMFGVRLAVVSVGVSRVREPLNRMLLRKSLRKASYRSFRDEFSRESAADMGVDTSSDDVVPDLAFCLPTPPPPVQRSGMVGLGVIAWWGAESDRASADEIHATYRERMHDLLGGLVDAGHSVRLLVGDDIDIPVATDLRDSVLAERPWFDGGSIVFDPVATLGEYMAQVVDLDAVVASRFHNVLCALKCGVPTIAIGYGDKHRVLMERFGVGRFAHDIRTLDPVRLLESLETLLREGELLAPRLRSVSGEEERLLGDHLSALDELMGPRSPIRGRRGARSS
jgi:polysaccharide pyruvyl transferase WcaK-like protein